jgi:hypothetical protein
MMTHNFLDKFFTVALIFITLLLLFFSTGGIKAQAINNFKDLLSVENSDYIFSTFEEGMKPVDEKIVFTHWLQGLCEEKEVPFKVIYNLINRESQFCWWAYGVNENGTWDMGIMQLNSRYLPEFLSLYWDKEEPFNVWNPKHNAYIGVSLFKDLIKQTGSLYYACIAYNAGVNAVEHGTYPLVSLNYALVIMNGAE